MTLKAESPLYAGYTLSRSEGIILLKGAIPGEVIEIYCVEKKKDYSVASVKEILEPSPDRILPPCPAFGECGGCHYQFISYPRQVSIKEEVAIDCIKRIGKIETALDSSLISEPYYYRRRAQLKVSRNGKIGFYRTLSHDVVEFNECLLLSPELNTVIKKIKSLGIPSGLREIHLQSGNIVTAMLKGEGLNFDDIVMRFFDAGISGILFQDGTVKGAQQVCLDLNGYHYMSSPDSFFQSNWALNKRLVELFTTFVSRIRPRRVLDLYSGAGNFSLPISRFAREIVAVEENLSSFRDGRDNIEINEIKNIKFVNKPVEQFIMRKNTDLIIVDPPRTGLSKKIVKNIVEMHPEWLIYTSCNPSTLARDINFLREYYIPETLRVVDMFPQTYHIEMFGILKSKS